MVVHRQGEQHREEEERHPRLDAVDLLEAEQVGSDAVLEDQNEQAVRRSDRQQVQDDRRQRTAPLSGRRRSAG